MIRSVVGDALLFPLRAIAAAQTKSKLVAPLLNLSPAPAAPRRPFHSLRASRAAGLAVTCASLLACGGSPSAPSSDSTTAVIVNGTAPGVGGSAQFTATAAKSDGTSQPVTTVATWDTSNAAVATVNRGFVSGVAAGEADITARYQNATGRMHITVSTLPCSFSVSPPTVPISANGGTTRVTVSAGFNCSWTAASSDSFVTITSGASGVGTGTIALSVSVNTGVARTATLTIADRQVTVSQAAGNCVTSVSPSSVGYSAELKRGTVTVTAAAGCQWTATTTSSFISLNGIVSGTGSGSFMFQVFGNLTGAPRAGSIQVLAQTVSITQHAALGGTFLSFVSDPGDGIGQGWTLLHEAPTSTFTPEYTFTPQSTRNHAGLTIIASDGLNTLYWTLDFAAPQGQELVPGTYLNATRYPGQAPTVPGLDFSGDGRGCNTLSGQFTINDILFGGDGSLQRLQATFEQHCDGFGAALRGTIVYGR